jgi:uncharacterized repeat protein (TIGR04052 family)
MLARGILSTIVLSTSIAGCATQLEQDSEPGLSDQALSAAGGRAPAAVAATTAVTIRFRGRVGTATFACGTNYTQQGSTKVTVTPQDFRFFVQDLRLIRNDGVEVPVTLATRAPWQNPDVALIDFENRTGTCVDGNPETNTIITGTVPTGTYTGVAFKNGVPETLNHKNPTTLAAPLSTYAGMSWGWLTGFRFIKAEMQQVVSQGIPGVGWLHTGTTACTGNPQAGSVTCARPNRNDVKLTGFNASTNYIVADIGAMFGGTDLSQDSECHSSSSSVCTPMYSRVGINYANGQPAAGQVAFRVE